MQLKGIWFWLWVLWALCWVPVHWLAALLKLAGRGLDWLAWCATHGPKVAGEMVGQDG